MKNIHFWNYALLIISILFYASCTDNSNNKENENLKSRDTTTITKHQILTKKVDTIPIKSKSKFIGVWTELGKEDLKVEITQETFNYPEHNEKWRYKFSGDTLRIFELEGTLLRSPYFINDTLLLLSPDGGDFKYIRLSK